MKLQEENIKIENQLLKSRIEELENKLSIYETAASGANDGLWDWDSNNRLAFVSEPWKTMLGLDESQNLYELTGLWESLLHPDDRERAIEYFQKFQNSAELKYRQEFRMKHADGTYRWILSRATALRAQDGTMIRLSGSHTDITERINAIDALKLSEEKYRSLFENSLVGMFRTDFRTGRFLESNEKLWEIIGPKGEKPITTLDFYKNPKDRDLVVNLVREKGFAENVELEIRRLDGQLIWVSFSIKHYPEENILETILIDITETKHNLLELQKVNFELDSFVYHASHDLRSPLRSVLGLIDLYRIEESSKIKEQCIVRIEASIKRLDDLVQELLSISRNDRVSDDHIQINLMDEINNSIASYYNATDTKGLEIITKVRHHHKFKSDATRVRIILNNIISNAIKYRSFTEESSFIKIVAEVGEETVRLVIEDNGDGIEESKLPHIFDMFYRATEKSAGSGLGLYIVKKVIDKLGATIEVSSEELIGTKFSITIPNNHYKED